MERRSFLGSIIALFTAPKVVAKPKYEVQVKGPLGYKMFEMPYKNYGIMIPKGEVRRRDADGILVIGDGEMRIYQQGMFPCVRPNDIVATSDTDRLRCVSIEMDVMYNGKMYYRFRLRELQSPKKICGIPVIMVAGKWRQYRTGKNPDYQVTFMPIASLFKEG